MADITASDLGASRALQKLIIRLNSSETVNSILLSCSSSRTCSTAGSTNTQKPNIPLDCGAPAEHLTVGSMMSKRTEKEDEALAVENNKRKRRQHVESAHKREADNKERKRKQKTAGRQSKRYPSPAG